MNKAKVLKTAKPISIKDSSILKIIENKKNTITKLFDPTHSSLYINENEKTILNTLNYKIADVIYVREMWQRTAVPKGKKFNVLYHYRASEPEYTSVWNLSLSIPMDAIRIIKLITSIRVSKIQDLYPAIEDVDLDDNISEEDIQYYYNKNVWVYTLTFVQG